MGSTREGARHPFRDGARGRPPPPPLIAAPTVSYCPSERMCRHLATTNQARAMTTAAPMPMPIHS